ncbi:turripeptide Gsg9.2-like [Haematobia irritans]|uniref:turripeptide Gsg9.2-like n=1 Tax=Haematobia irritans TaxID=7368 RepID=UPI003F4FA85D
MASLKWVFTLTFLVILALANFPKSVDAQRRKCPQICPAVYSPVCATLSDGSRRQFPNKCSMTVAACTQNLRIKTSRPGTC